MAQPYDSSAQCRAVTEYLMEDYHMSPLDSARVVGNMVHRLFDPDAEPILGDGKHFKTRDHIGDFARSSGSDAQAAFTPGTIPQFRDVKVRFKADDSSTNDLVHIKNSVRINEYLMLNATNEKGIINVADDIQKQFKVGVPRLLSLLLSIPKTAVLGQVNGTPKLNNDKYYANASAIGSGASMRVTVDGCAIAAFMKGMYVDFYRSGVRVYAGAKITDTNVIDGSVGFSANSSSDVFTGIADNDDIVLQDQYNKGFRGLEQFFVAPSSGDSWFGGTDRTSSDYFFLRPNLLRSGESTYAPITKSMLDDYANARASLDDSANGKWVTVARAHHTLITKLKDQYDQAVFVQQTTDADVAKMIRQLGSEGVSFRHAACGTIALNGDPLCRPTKMQMLCVGDWVQVYFGNKNMKYFPGEQGMFYRAQTSTPGEGKGMDWQADGYFDTEYYCLFPERQFEIQYLSAT